MESTKLNLEREKKIIKEEDFAKRNKDQKKKR